jgi:hypothetical protein
VAQAHLKFATFSGCAMFQIFRLYFGGKYEHMFRNLEADKQQIIDLDPNVERSAVVRRTLENGISFYRKLYKIVETTLDKYFYRK